MPGQQVQARIDGNLKDKFNYFLDTHKNFNSSGLVRAALENYLFEESEFDEIHKQIIRLKKELTETLEEQHEHITTFTESFFVFLKYYFAYSPELSDPEKDEAKSKAMTSYSKYTKSLIANLTSEKTVTEKILKLKSETKGGEYASR